MLYFVLGACVGFALPAAWDLLSGAAGEIDRIAPVRRLRDALHRALGLQPDAAPLATTARLGAVLLAGLALAVAEAATNWLTDALRFFETARGFRSLLGGLFGVALLLLFRRFAAPRGSEATGGGGAGDPWFTRPGATLPAAMLALAVYAIIAPRGELNLAFLQSVKTPFGEAEFTRNQVELDLRIESEPTEYFRIDRRGLGDALFFARAELMLQEVSAVTPDDQRALRRTRHAWQLIESVLQPVALCIQQIDSLYGDQTLLEESLAIVGSGLARAIMIARHDLDGAKAAAALMQALTALETRRALDADVLRGTVGPDKPYAGDLCSRWTPIWGDPMASLRAIGEESPHRFAVALLHPAVVHAAATFYLWSGNWRGAQALIEGADSGPKKPYADFADYPGLGYVRGFVRRWLDTRSATTPAYLDAWDAAILALKARLDRLADAQPEAVAACRGTAMPAVRFAANPPPVLDRLSSTSLLPADCGLATAPPSMADGKCRVPLAYGYLFYALQRFQNHYVFETARERMARRNWHDAEMIVSRAEAHAQDIRRTAEGRLLHKGGCATRQTTELAAAGRPDGREVPPAYVTSGDPDIDYAFYLDSAGLLAFSQAARANDRDGIEAARALFQQSLDMAKGKLGPDIRNTIVDHEAEASRMLGNL